MSDTTFNYTFIKTSERGFEWRVKVNNYEFNYFTGFGHINPPQYLDVLNCLYSDMQLGQETFQDFCDNCGYDTDSRKSLKMYLECQKTANKLRGFEFPQEIIYGDY